MKMLMNDRKISLILTLCVSLAALTNHSHGEVVYRKLSTSRSGFERAETTPIIAQNSTEAESSGAMKVLRIQPRGATTEVLLAGGFKEGLLPGTSLEARRLRESLVPYQKPLWIPTALLKTIAVRENYTLAELITDGSIDSSLHFPEAPGLMVGDSTQVLEQKITQNIRILPTRVLTYERLFLDPKILPTSFELSAPGRALLLEQAKVLIDAHSQLLLVEGHTDPQGDSPSNQVESYQRAMTVRQVLIDEFALDPSRIVAIGLGETEALDEPYLPGRAEEARRIVLKVKSQTSPH